MTEYDNMKIWNSVCETDPATTKAVSQRGGFTAICAQSQLKRATELWGPYGHGWGISDPTYSLIHDAAGEPIEAVLEGVFDYPAASFPISADMAYKPGNDTRKKLLTDATTKALSKLGFNADVFEGRFDDNKYVAAMRTKFADTPEKPKTPLPDVNIDGLRSDAGAEKLRKWATIENALVQMAKTRTVTPEARKVAAEFYAAGEETP